MIQIMDAAERDLALAFAAYLATDESHRREPAVTLLTMPGARMYVVGRVRDLTSTQQTGRDAVWWLAAYDAITRLRDYAVAGCRR